MVRGRGPRTKHVPIRTCIGCQQESAKRELIRIVRTPEGRVAIDPTGRMPGRGAYLHPQRTCWEKALKRGSIRYALKITPAPDDVEALRAFGMSLPEEEGDDAP
jgi:predicted RNA-binding protein YlxR (DUF448 family)